MRVPMMASVRLYHSACAIRGNAPTSARQVSESGETNPHLSAIPS